jgi:RHS repeat-associated protein
MRDNGVVYWLLSDHLGSTNVSYRQDTGAVVTQKYYPWGTIRGGTNQLPTDYTYTGQKLDTGDGLMYYGARFYDPYLNRFTQPDTIVPEPGNPQSLNRYAYVLNNPLRYVDPSGHLSDDEIKAYTDYDTDEDFDALIKNNPQLYWMLRALHFDDSLYAWFDGQGRKSYRATLKNRRLFFTPEDRFLYPGDTQDRKVGYFAQAEKLALGRFHTNDAAYGFIAGGFSWEKGLDPEKCYESRWKSVDTYRTVSDWDYFWDFKLQQAVGTGLIGAGVGMLVGPVGPVPGGVVAFAIGLTVDLGGDLPGVPAGRYVGDRISTYAYDGLTETVVVRDGAVIAHTYARK